MHLRLNVREEVADNILSATLHISVAEMMSNGGQILMRLLDRINTGLQVVNAGQEAIHATSGTLSSTLHLNCCEAIQALFEQVHLRCLSTYHAWAAVREIANAGLEQEDGANPYLASIASLARKEEEHGMATADLLATCAQVLLECKESFAEILQHMQCV
ncbi:MAG: hypothetical protein RML15_06505 [Bacteroidota bacterium]|nr:hypothetical protein [Candidatus Kapabacteria bacterium]MDW8075063.1 hypothetical protein [Bacteroidota bacterium]MDW8272043.1 hypothetical protein [Bacteroidota bacterium]